MRVLEFAFAAAVLTAHPLAAQEAEADNAPAATEVAEAPDAASAALGEMMKTLFQVEPLTPGQRALLPQAEAVVARIMPPGTMQDVMGGMYEKLLGPMMAMAGEPSSSEIARELGAEPDSIELDQAEAAEIAGLLDPAWKQRRELEGAAVQRAMTAAMSAMEPGMRKGLSEAYAANFTAAELSDIDRFFATPSGAAFARKSYALASDPRLMAAGMDGLPAMMGQMKAMEEEVRTATARLPARRGYADLTAPQRATIARLTGLGQGALREGMERAAAERVQKDAGAEWDED